MNYFKPLTLLVFLVSFTNFSQNTDNKEDKLSLDNGTIDNQFEYVTEKSNSWRNDKGQEYKLINTFWLSELRAHVLDSVKTAQNEVKETQITLKAQSQEISDLKASLSNIQDSLDKTKNEKDNMSFFGAQMSKGSYTAIMWGMVAVLLGLLLFFIYKFKNSNTITKDAKRVLSELEDEFEEHRKNAVEREQKIRRQLLDEINKQKTTTNRTKK
jgi:septal ring factor EnvC (AmiA/AmiB activator)